MRRAVAAAAAVALMLEAAAIAFVQWVTGLAVRHQEMSLAGLEPAAMAAGAWAGGGLFAAYLAACGVLLARAARRDRAPGRPARVTLIGCAVVHAMLGAAVAAPVGWTAFALVMAVLGLVVLSLLLYEGEAAAGLADPPPVAPAAA